MNFRVSLKSHICPNELVKLLTPFVVKLFATLTVKFCSLCSQSEVKFAQKLLLTCATRGANFTLAVAETSLLRASLARGELSCRSDV